MEKLINTIVSSNNGGGGGSESIEAELVNLSIEGLPEAQALVSTVTLHTVSYRVLTQVSKFLLCRHFPMVDVGRAFLQCQMVSMRDIGMSVTIKNTMLSFPGLDSQKIPTPTNYVVHVTINHP